MVYTGVSRGYLRFCEMFRGAIPLLYLLDYRQVFCLPIVVTEYTSLVNHCHYSVSVSLSFCFHSFLSACASVFFIFLSVANFQNNFHRVFWKIQYKVFANSGHYLKERLNIILSGESVNSALTIFSISKSNCPINDCFSLGMYISSSLNVAMYWKLGFSRCWW